MSAPTRGMVAGKPITTGELTREYESGHERIFGKDRKPIRGRFVFDDVAGCMVEVGADWEPEDRPGPSLKSEAEVYGHIQATDGTDVSTRRRHREYMKANGLSMASDFTEHWKTAEKRRAAVQSGDADTKERREIVGRALHEARHGRLKAPKLETLEDE